MTLAQSLHELHTTLPAHHQYALQLLIARVERLEQAMRGIASCATACGCCEMHKRIALAAAYPGETEGAT